MTAPTIHDISERYRHTASLGNPVLDLNPFVLLLSIAAIAAMAVATPGWKVPVAVSVVFVLIAFLASRGVSYLINILKLWLVIGLILFVLRALLIEGDRVLLTLGPLTVTAEGLQEGLRFSTAVMAITGGVTLFFALVPMRHLMLALENLGVSPRVSYVLLASFQAITDLGATARTVLDAQKARGIETEGNVIVRARAFFPVLAPVFLSAMSATEERAIALDARAFNSHGRRTTLLRLRPTPAWEWIIAIALWLGVAAIITGRVLGWF